MHDRLLHLVFFGQFSVAVSLPAMNWLSAARSGIAEAQPLRETTIAAAAAPAGQPPRYRARQQGCS